MNTNWLANIFNWIGDTFEDFNPAAFRFLSAILPYLTPLPVAWLTADSASEFLGFTPRISFIFVFTLEGMGLWFTSMLVDAVVDWIKSRNVKTFSLVLLFGFVVGAYVFILVNLNVILKASAGEIDSALSNVITLLCFLPLLTGIGNGYYKLKLEHKKDTKVRELKKEDLEERIRQERREDRIKNKLIKEGYGEQVLAMAKDVQNNLNYTEFAQPVVKDSVKRFDFRRDERKLRKDAHFILNAPVKDVQNKYSISRKTVYNWRELLKGE